MPFCAPADDSTGSRHCNISTSKQAHNLSLVSSAAAFLQLAQHILSSAASFSSELIVLIPNNLGGVFCCFFCPFTKTTVGASIFYAATLKSSLGTFRLLHTIIQPCIMEAVDICNSSGLIDNHEQ